MLYRVLPVPFFQLVIRPRLFLLLQSPLLALQLHQPLVQSLCSLSLLIFQFHTLVFLVVDCFSFLIKST
jgi:hypothetical protein